MEPSRPPESLAVAPRFAQQGTVDWGRLASSVISYTVEVLARLAAANVQPLTVEMGSVACAQFNISAEGRSRVRTALDSLTYSRSFSSVQWFGFGIKHIVHTLSVSDGGLTCLSICGALSEHYPDDMAVEILNELCRSLKAPAKFNPSIVQWAELLKSCAGVFANTEFGTRMGEFQQRAQPAGNRTLPRVCASPRSIVEVLQGIASLSRGENVAIAVAGGHDIFWLATLCQWLFSLRIEIQNAEGLVMYAEDANQDPQVTFILQDSSMSIHAPRPATLTIVRKIYSLQYTTNLIRSRLPNLLTVGRAPWECVFQSTFGEDFEKLIQHPHEIMGVAIGSAARIFRAIVAHESRVSPLVPLRWRSYHSASYGRGFVEFIVERFPELKPLGKTIHLMAQQSLQDAKSAYDDIFGILAENCNCRMCGTPREDLEHYCRVAILETIIALAHALSQTHILPGLYLKKGSIMKLYRRQDPRRQKRSPANRDSQAPLLPRPEDFGVFRGVVDDIMNVSPNDLGYCLSLFVNHEACDPAVALSESGICCFRGIMIDGLSDSLDESALIHIMCGSIEHNEESFSRICDDEDSSPTRISAPLSEISALSRVTSYSTAEAILTETLNGLTIRFDLSAPEDPSLGSLGVYPGRLLDAIALAQGWINCPNHNCQFLRTVPPGNNVMLDVHGNEVRIVKGGKTIRTAALTLARAAPMACFLQGTECLQCCLRSSIGESVRMWYEAGGYIFQESEIGSLRREKGYPAVIISASD